MPDPTRPVDSAEIETAWGQAVHDATFAPKGTHITGNTVKACGTTPLNLELDTATEDPGGWVDLAANKITCPAGADGLYWLHARINIVNGDAGEGTRCWFYLNNAQREGTTASNDGSTNVKMAIDGLVYLTAADFVHVRGAKTGGANVDVTLLDLWAVRIASELGA